MLALAVADICPDPPLGALLEERTPDLVLLLGDLEPSMLSALSGREVPVFGVYGNHCTVPYLEQLGAENLHGRAVRFGGLMFGGLEGAPRYKPVGFHLYEEDEVALNLSGLPPVDVLITHTPPRGINDHPGFPAHEGFVALRQHIERTPPRHLLHGHTNPKTEELVVKHGDTRVHWVYGAAWVELD